MKVEIRFRLLFLHQDAPEASCEFASGAVFMFKCSGRYTASKGKHMKIFVLNDRSAQTVNILLHIWERSVRATHSFLSCAEIEKIKSYVPRALQNVQNLVVAKDEDDAVTAFLGIEGKRIEMLFVEPERRGRGTGRALVAFAADTFGVNEVTVNEQNAQAVGFYKRMGFNTYKRTELDEQGDPYPLLYMRM